MSDPEDFLTRWARRKREADAAPADRDKQGAAEARASDRAADAASEPKPAPAADASEPLFDLTKLPPIESITAETDIRAFFAPGVPAELTRAALRRAWVADPKIKDFVGLADYDWDFHTPGAIPGFGPLEMTDDLRREVLRIVGGLLPEEKPAGPAAAAAAEPAVPPAQPTAAIEEINAPSLPPLQSEEPGAGSVPDHPAARSDESAPATATTQRNKDIAAMQQDASPVGNLQTSARRGHGGALPK